MKILFIYKNFENLGISYLSSVLKKNGHQTALIMYFAEDPYFGTKKNNQNLTHLVKAAINHCPDLIAFSSVTDDFIFFSKVARKIKKRSNIPIIFGGVHVTIVPDKVIKKDFIDIICIGDGEQPLLNLSNRFEDYLAGKNLIIPGIWYKNNGKIIKNKINPAIKQLDTIPFPDKEIFYKAAPFFQEEYLIMASRGCPYNCSYCYNSIKQHNRNKETNYRRRSANNVIDELTRAKKKWNIKRIFFFDDAFTADKNWLLNFLDLYKKKIKLEFSCITNINFIDKELVHSLKNSKCVKICVGIETWNENIRRDILHRNDKNEKIFSAVKAIKKSGMYIQTDHLLGIPGEKMEDHIRALKLYNIIRPNHISVYWMKYYPGIKLLDMLKKDNILSCKDIKNIEDGTYSKKSYLHGGSMKNPESLYGINFLMNILPVTPKYLIDFLIKIKFYNFFKPKSYLISNMLPKFIKTIIFSNDVSGRYYIKRYFFMRTRKKACNDIWLK